MSQESGSECEKVQGTWSCERHKRNPPRAKIYLRAKRGRLRRMRRMRKDRGEESSQTTKLMIRRRRIAEEVAPRRSQNEQRKENTYILAEGDATTHPSAERAGGGPVLSAKR